MPTQLSKPMKHTCNLVRSTKARVSLVASVVSRIEFYIDEIKTDLKSNTYAMYNHVVLSL